MTLFVETTETGKVNKVITPESLSPFLNALLTAKLYDENVDINKAEISRMLVEIGFDFLLNSSLMNLAESHRRVIEEAVDLSRYFTTNFRQFKKRGD